MYSNSDALHYKGLTLLAALEKGYTVILLKDGIIGTSEKKKSKALGKLESKGAKIL